MKFVTHNEESIEAKGLFALGAIRANYTDLYNLFGKPQLTLGDALGIEWLLRFGDRVASIHNYIGTISKNPTPENTYLWLVAGNTEKVNDDVMQVLADPIGAIRRQHGETATPEVKITITDCIHALQGSCRAATEMMRHTDEALTALKKLV